MRALVIVSFALACMSLAGRCGTTGGQAKCKEYLPLSMCSVEFEHVCQTTDDGCEQCSCVPKKHVRESPGSWGPVGPRP